VTQARTALVGLAEIQTAASRVAALAHRTPALRFTGSAAPVFLKCENMQRTGAFKLRGAANMLQLLPDGSRRNGVITYSSGNHGQAVALAAQSLGVPAVVVMPTTAPAVKVAGARAFGAEVIFEGTTSAERRVCAEQEAVRRCLTIVPPFDHEWIIAGQGTVGLEILEQVPDVGLVLVPIGGGGLIAGVAAAIKLSRPGVRVVGVEPEGANAMQQSLASGEPVTLARTASIADGLLPTRPGALTFAHVRAFVDEIVTVSDEAIVATMRRLYDEAKIVVEPSGATGLAALLAGSVAVPSGPQGPRPIVAVLSGGNVSPQHLSLLLDPVAAASS
jgi:threonine dehydratase